MSAYSAEKTGLPKSGRFSRNKGKRGERAVALALRQIYGNKVARGWQARRGDDAPDVVGTPFFIEVKAHKRVNVRRAFEQLMAAKGSDPRPPLLFAKDDHREWIAVVLMDDFLAILREVINLKSVSTSGGEPCR